MIPENYKEAVLKQYHDECSHGGIEKPVGPIRNNYHWVELYRDVAQHVMQCITCKIKSLKKSRVPLQGMDEVLFPGQKWGLGLCDPYQEPFSDSKYILTAVDLYRRWSEMYHFIRFINQQTFLKHPLVSPAWLFPNLVRIVHIWVIAIQDVCAITVSKPHAIANWSFNSLITTLANIFKSYFTGSVTIDDFMPISSLSWCAFLGRLVFINQYVHHFQAPSMSASHRGAYPKVFVPRTGGHGQRHRLKKSGLLQKCVKQ